MSFLTWRILKEKLPFEDVLIKYGKHMDSKCNCCQVEQDQTLNHIGFNDGKVGSYIWNLFGPPLGITHSQIPIWYVLDSWWKERTKNDLHKLILHITPIIIC